MRIVLWHRMVCRLHAVPSVILRRKGTLVGRERFRTSVLQCCRLRRKVVGYMINDHSYGSLRIARDFRGARGGRNSLSSFGPFEHQLQGQRISFSRD